ncbi:alpha/beta-hydrolase [Trametes maxima]|nr:alpha/beta-hydrolase [Trametes maxima]
MVFFRFRHQPLKAMYYVYAGLSLLFVQIPYWVVRYALPSTRPQPWSLGRIVIVKCLRALVTTMFRTSVALMNLDPLDVEKSGKGEEVGLVWVDAAPELVTGEIEEAAYLNGIEAERRAGYWFGKRGPNGKAGQPAGPDERVIYSFHGGGFVMGSAHPSFATGYICSEMLKYAKGYERIFQIEFRLSSSDPLPAYGAFPAALVDGLAGYKYLVHTLGFKPSNILVMGESAGGGLALQLTRYLSQNNLPGLGCAPPGAQLLLSPTSDWGRTHTGPDSSFERNRDNDMVHAFFDGFPAKSLLGNLPSEAAWTNSWISPGSLRLANPEGLFKGLPPTCIIVGGAEMTLDPVKAVRDRIVADNGDGSVHYVELPHACHVPMTHAWHDPERTQGYEATAKWLTTLD